MKKQYSLTFLRHAQSELNLKNKFCGRIDCGITEDGKLLASKLRSMEPFSTGFDIIYSSPLRRTRQTLNCIFPDARPIIDERLIVINYGDLEGTNMDSVSTEIRKAYKNGGLTPPNGENFHDVEKRADSFLRYIDKKFSGTNINILVVTHGSVLRVLRSLCGKKRSEPSNNLDFYTFNQDEIKEYLNWREANAC